MSRLRELVLEPSAWCPLSCSHCSSSSGPLATVALDPATCFRVINEAADLGVTQLSFGGGEPTSFPFLMDCVRAALRRSVKAEIFTSGIRLRERRFTSLAKPLLSALRETGQVKLIFSFLGGSPEVHDGLTGVPGSQELTLESLDKALGVCLPVELNFVPLRPNAASFSKLVALAEERGIAKISLLRFVPQGRGHLNRAELEMSRREEKLFLAEVSQIQSSARVLIRTGSPYNQLIRQKIVPCRAGDGKIVVQPDGNVIPCEVFKHSSRRDWSASVTQNSLADIVSSASFRELRAAVRAENCARCPVHTKLAVGPITE